MESSIKAKKIQSMEKYKRDHHQFLYNLILYSLTSMITFLFFSYPFWLHFIKQCLYSFTKNILFLFDAKFLFILGNIIVFILIRESRLTRPRSSAASEIYDEYVARSCISRAMSSNNNFIANKKEDVFVQNLDIGRNLHHEEKKVKEIRVSKSVRQHKKKQSVLRASKSEVWGKSGEIMKTKGHDGKLHHEEKKRKEIRVLKSVHQHEETKSRLRASKTEVWGENEEVGKSEGNDENLHHEGKMSVSKNMHHDDQENKRGLRASKSEVWGESAKVEKERATEKKVEQFCMPTEELNTKVEAFIARVNKQMLLEAKLLRDGRA